MAQDVVRIVSGSVAPPKLFAPDKDAARRCGRYLRSTGRMFANGCEIQAKNEQQHN